MITGKDDVTAGVTMHNNEMKIDAVICNALPIRFFILLRGAIERR